MVKLLQDTFSTFRTVFTGMGITWSHLFTKSVTLQYPDQRDVLPDRVRLKLDVNMDDCIGCRLCERACPVECITIDTIKTTDDVDLGETSTGHKKKLWVAEFDIDMAKCCYCELCVHPCPTDCINMVEDYEYSSYDRNDFILPFAEMSPEQIEIARVKLAQEEEEKEKQKEAVRLEKERKKAEAAQSTTSDDVQFNKTDDSGSVSTSDASESGAFSTDTPASPQGPERSNQSLEKFPSTETPASSGDSDAEREARKAEREARRAERRAARDEKKDEN